MKQLTKKTARRALRVAMQENTRDGKPVLIWGTIYDTHDTGVQVIWDDGAKTDTTYEDLFVE